MAAAPLAIDYWAIKRIRARLERIRAMNRQRTERLGLRVYCILSVIRILRPLTEFGLRDGLQIAYKDWISVEGIDGDQAWITGLYQSWMILST